jgi:hypothetical protein
MDMQDVPRDLAHDVKRIEQVVRREFYPAQKIPEKSSAQIKKPLILSLLLLASAKFGEYSFDQLEPAAAGLELLNLGANKHYRENVRDLSSGCEVDSTSLIMGDYYYSKGISVASGSGISFVIEIMSQAIVDLTEAQAELGWNDRNRQAESFSRYREVWSKRAALFSAACRLGALLGEAGEERTRDLERFGCSIGFILKFTGGDDRAWGIPDGQEEMMESLIVEAKRSLGNLPENEYKSFLTRLPEGLISCLFPPIDNS